MPLEIDEKRVREILSEIREPINGINVFNLGLVQKVEVGPGTISVFLTTCLLEYALQGHLLGSIRESLEMAAPRHLVYIHDMTFPHHLRS